MDIYGAIFAAQGDLHGVVRDAKNPHFKNRYATLEQVIETIKPALRKHGVGFMQMPGAIVNGAIEIQTVFFSGDGKKEPQPPNQLNAYVAVAPTQTVTFTTHVPLPKQDPQGLGSALTYGCRYALMAALGLPPVDDDGNAGSLPSRSDIAPHDDPRGDIPIPRENPNAKSAYSIRKGQPAAWNEVVEFMHEAEDPADLKIRCTSDWFAEKTRDWPASWLQTLRTETYQSILARFQLEPAQ